MLTWQLLENKSFFIFIFYFFLRNLALVNYNNPVA